MTRDNDGKLSIARVVETYRAYCLAVANSFRKNAVGGAARPSDIVQEAMIVAVRNARKGTLPVDDDLHLKRWLRQVIVGLHVSHLRRERRVRRGGLLTVVAGTDEPPTDPGTSPSARAARGEAREIVALAFSRLDAREQDLVRWRYVDRLSCRVIGERLGVSGEYASRITRAALDRLRADLPSFGEEASA